MSATLAAAIATAACGNDGTVQPPPPPPPPPPPMDVCTNGAIICTTSTLTDQTLELNAQGATQTFNVMGNAGYSGMVSVTVVRTAIDALSGGKEPDVHVAAVPGIFAFTGGGQPMPVSVSVSTSAAAAAFATQPVTLHVADMADSTKSFDVKFNLTVSNNLTVTFAGTGTGATLHTWSTDSAAATVGQNLILNVRQRAVAAGQGGTTFTFLNKDTNPHIIHGTGVITHQNTGGTGTAPNATYSVANVNNTLKSPPADGFYCHTHGTGGSVAPPTERAISFVP